MTLPRRLLPFLLLAGCAHIEAPPGGPEDLQGPRLLTTRPDTMARLESFRGPVVLVFDEGLSEDRVQEAVDVSPRTGPVSVEKRGDEIRVDLRRGWERGRIYQVTVEPVIRDRFNNRLEAPVRLVFSTGPEIPDTRLTGRVVERQTARPAQGARVEAILAPDSLVYAARTDTGGVFVLQNIPVGTYVVRAYQDPNGNRALESFEARDTTSAVVAEQPVEVALSIVTPDSTPPQLTSAAAERQVVTVRFDDFLDPAQPMDAVQVQVFGPDSVRLEVAAVAVGSLPAPPDTAGADAPPTARDTAAADTAVPPLPVPAQHLSVRVATPLAADALHRVTVTGVRNLVGLAGGGTVQFRAPRARAADAPAPADDAEPPPQVPEPDAPEEDPAPPPPEEDGPEDPAPQTPPADPPR